MIRCSTYCQRPMNPLTGIWPSYGNALGYRYASPDGDGFPVTCSVTHSHTDHCSLITDHWTYTFSAKERDTETGLSYFGSRYYSSDLSIWLSVDPMSDKYASLSPYAYCADNPVRLVDPNGEEVVEGKPPFKLFEVLNKLDRKIEGSSQNREFEGHSDGANQVTDDKVVDFVKPVMVPLGEVLTVSSPVGETVNFFETLTLNKDLFGNETSGFDKVVTLASPPAKIASIGINVLTKSPAVKQVSKSCSQTIEKFSKAYTSVKLFIRPHSSHSKSDNENKS